MVSINYKFYAIISCLQKKIVSLFKAHGKCHCRKKNNRLREKEIKGMQSSDEGGAIHNIC
jgi:hypothetical protein